MDKVNGRTMNIVQDNIDRLKEIFPDVFSEGKIDFEALKTNLGEVVEVERERYSFNWNGKQEAKEIALTPSTGTLRPDKESSKNWDSTENLYIEGDNLEVLKLLQKSYHNKIKMIYIDPPYNTGKDFVYKDNFKDNIQNYKEQTGQVDDEGNKLTTNSDQSGRYHSNWLNMMYPRLKLARNLLTDDGVIFMSIDDNELFNLKKICDEIFGEDNFLNNVSIKMSESSGNKMAHANKRLPKLKESLLIYKKSNIDLKIVKIKKNTWDNEYSNILLNFTYDDFEYLKLLQNKEECSNAEIGKLDNILKKVEISSVSKELKEKNITNQLEWKLKNSYRIFRTASSSSVKILCDEKKKKVKQPIFSVVSKKEKNIYLVKSDYLMTSRSPRVQILIAQDNLEISIGDFWNDINTTGLEAEGGVSYKNGKKPLKFIERCLKLSTKSNDIILDFFSGSSTTAEAVLNLNLIDNNNRKFIMVQLNENLKNSLKNTSEKNSKSAILESMEFLDRINKKPFLSELGKERIRRAGEKILEENSDKDLSNLDIGFKTFKLDSSNIKEWDPEYANEDLTRSLFEHVDNIKDDRSEEDILFELLLKHGIDLTTPIIETKKDGKTIYNLGAGLLFICLDDNLDKGIAQGIIEESKEWESPKVSVIFKDTGFKSDMDKTNVIQTLKIAGITDVKSV